LKIGNNDYFLQSANYDAGAQTGTRIDLQNGTLKGYNFNLSLKGNNGSINIDSTASTYPLQLGSNFKVDWNGNITASGGTIGGWNINDSSIYGGNTTLSKDGKITTDQLFASGGRIEDLEVGALKINNTSVK
jgi:hypothetical protein